DVPPTGQPQQTVPAQDDHHGPVLAGQGRQLLQPFDSLHLAQRPEIGLQQVRRRSVCGEKGVHGRVLLCLIGEDTAETRRTPTLLAQGRSGGKVRRRWRVLVSVRGLDADSPPSIALALYPP